MTFWILEREEVVEPKDFELVLLVDFFVTKITFLD